jgi:uncharacterized protein
VTNRDRDRAGRPRNARPRDELGRPLPRSAPQPVTATAPPDDVAGSGSTAAASGSATLTPGESAGIGGSLLLDGHPFHAHEVFEDAWKVATGPERDLWRGLAQVAVGLTHARRGNARGAAALLTRGADRLRDYTEQAGTPGTPGPYGIDVAFVANRAAELAAQIERDGLDALPPQALLLSLGLAAQGPA